MNYRSKTPTIVSILQRRLKTGQTFADFQQAHLPDKLAEKNEFGYSTDYFNVPTRVIHAISAQNPNIIFSIGLSYGRSDVILSEASNQEKKSIRGKNIDQISHTLAPPHIAFVAADNDYGGLDPEYEQTPLETVPPEVTTHLNKLMAKDLSVTDLNHITLAVTNIDVSFTFYKDMLGMKPLVKWDKGAYFLLGSLWFCLNVDASRSPQTCTTHYAFTVSKEAFEPMCERIRVSGTQTFQENTSPGDSHYFLDPDGHKLEIHTEAWYDRIHHKKQETGQWSDVQWFV